MSGPPVRTMAHRSRRLGAARGDAAALRAAAWLRLALRPRLLPILIFVASLFLSVKIGLIWRDTREAGSTAGAIAISNAQAGSAESAAAGGGAPAQA